MIPYDQLTEMVHLYDANFPCYQYLVVFVRHASCAGTDGLLLDNVPRLDRIVMQAAQ